MINFNILKKIKRVREEDKRNFKKGIRSDRNEKVENWPSNIFQKIFSKISNHEFTAYYNTSELLSLESKIGQDVETSGLKRYIKRELEKINICPLEEKKYIKLKIDYHLKRTRDYAVSGNERMTNFYRKKTEQLMIEFDCSQLSSLNRIQIDKEKIGSFKKKEISSNFEMATKYALLGDRNTFNFYKNKLLVEENESEKDILERISEIEKIITPFIEIKFLTTKIFKYLKYAEDKAKLKDKARMERYLNQSDRYYQRLLSFPVEDEKNLEIKTRIKLINQVFNCPI